jgi:ADP-ribose pyrophosphatase
MSGGRDFILGNVTEKCNAGFLSIDEVTYQVRKYDGTLSETQTRQVMQRGDAAAVLAYNKDLQKFILIEQFRIATVLSDKPGEGWLLELPAGGIKAPKETARECARRELGEETGYNVWGADADKDLEELERFKHIATLFPSPGGSSERIYIYYVEVTEDDNKAVAGVKPDETEDIRLVPLSPDALFKKLDKCELQDAKLVVAAQWFRATMPDRESKTISIRYAVKKQRGLVGIKGGNIAEVKGVDVWVNSENTDMLMDRFFGTSISATIRYLGAAKHANGTIYRDSIAEALRGRLGGQIFVKPATVVVTKPGALRRRPHKVRRILHVAAVQALQGKGLYANINVSAECLRAVLLQAEALNWGFRRIWGFRHIWRPYRSIVIPLLGAGQGGVTAQDLASVLVPAAIDFLEKNDDPLLREIFFVAYKASDVRLLEDELASHKDRIELVTDDAPTNEASGTASPT